MEQTSITRQPNQISVERIKELLRLGGLDINGNSRIRKQSDTSSLSHRETQLVWMAMVPNKLIAGYLGLKESTVKQYYFRIFEKLGVTGRMDLILSTRGLTIEELGGGLANLNCSRRTKETIALVVSGYSNGNIGNILGITEHYAKNILLKTFEQYNLGRREDLFWLVQTSAGKDITKEV